MSNHQVIKYMLIGSNEVGKSSFLYRFCENKFLNDYEESKGVDFKQKMFDNGKYKICLFDTPGTKNLRYSSYGFYKGAFGFILIFDLTKPQTLYDLRDDFSKIASQSSSYAQLILVGNKSDLEVNQDLSEVQNEAEKMASELNIPFFQISCLTGQNVELIIDDLTRRVEIQINNGNLGNKAGSQNNEKDEKIRHEGGCCCNTF